MAKKVKSISYKEDDVLCPTVTLPPVTSICPVMWAEAWDASKSATPAMSI
jgi:hypothetical protein